MGVYDGVFPLLILSLKLGYILARCYDNNDNYRRSCWECNSAHTECIDCNYGYYLSSGEC